MYKYIYCFTWQETHISAPTSKALIWVSSSELLTSSVRVGETGEMMDTSHGGEMALSWQVDGLLASSLADSTHDTSTLFSLSLSLY